MNSPQRSYSKQFQLCYPLTPARTDNQKILFPRAEVYNKPYDACVYPAQNYRFVSRKTFNCKSCI